MGQMLSEPVKDKRTDSGSDSRLAYAVSEMQGWRYSMEDAHTHQLKLDDDPDDQGLSYFAVYDGHGGANVAKFASDTVYKRLPKNLLKEHKYADALTQAFLKTDEDQQENELLKFDPSGCTAVAILVTNDYTIYCANAGDSRCVMSVDGKCEPLSTDHKPTLPEERDRIVKAGGYVQFGRVNGNLALSRALGDLDFKKNSQISPQEQAVTSNPDIVEHKPGDHDEFVVLACDGIWDVLESQQVIDFVRRRVAEHKPLSEICEEVISTCMSPLPDFGGLGCDNMTIMIVALLKGKSIDEWYDAVKARVESSDSYATPKDVPTVSRFSEGEEARSPISPQGSSAATFIGAGSSDSSSPLSPDSDSPDSLALPRITRNPDGTASVVLPKSDVADVMAQLRYHPSNSDDANDNGQYYSRDRFFADSDSENEDSPKITPVQDSSSQHSENQSSSLTVDDNDHHPDDAKVTVQEAKPTTAENDTSSSGTSSDHNDTASSSKSDQSSTSDNNDESTVKSNDSDSAK